MLNAHQLIEDAFAAPEEGEPNAERQSRRFKWTPPAAKTKHGGADDGEELPVDPNAPQLDSPEGAQELSHAELLAQGGMDHELSGDDVLDLFNKSKGYQGPNRQATNKGRAAFKSQANRLRGYAGFGEAHIRKLVDDILG